MRFSGVTALRTAEVNKIGDEIFCWQRSPACRFYRFEFPGHVTAFRLVERPPPRGLAHGTAPGDGRLAHGA